LKDPKRRKPNFLLKAVSSLKSFFLRTKNEEPAPQVEKWTWGDVGRFTALFGFVAFVAPVLFPTLGTYLTSGRLFQRVGVVALYVGVTYGLSFVRFAARRVAAHWRKGSRHDAIWAELQAQRQLVAALTQQMAADHQFEVLKVQFFEGEMRVLLDKGTGVTKLSVGQKLAVLDVSDGRFMATLEIHEETQARYGAVAVQLDPLWNGYIRKCAGAGNMETEPPFPCVALFVANPEAPELNG